MATLPTPGGDSGTWGAELNEWALVSHADSGLLEMGESAAIVDGTAWVQRTLGTIGQTMTAVGTATPNSANEHALVMQIKGAATSSGAGYQKTGILIQAQTDDPSSATVRNMVALDARGIVGSTNATGRAWGLYGQGQILAGGDGTVFTSELVLINEGTDVALPGSSLQKVGLNNVARGTNPSTVAYSISNADTGYWHHGLYSTAAALGTGAADSFIELAQKFTVFTNPAGKLIIGAASSLGATNMLEVQATTNSDPLVAFGNASGSNHFTIQLRNSVGAGKWFLTGSAGAFLTGTAAGDMGFLMPTSGKSIHLGGTASVVQVTQDNKLGVFQATPVVKQTVSGSRGGNAALASLIDAMEAFGFITDSSSA